VNKLTLMLSSALFGMILTSSFVVWKVLGEVSFAQVFLLGFSIIMMYLSYKRG